MLFQLYGFRLRCRLCRVLANALILSEAEPADGDLEFLDSQEALDQYVAHHGLFAQAAAASRLASRLP